MPEEIEYKYLVKDKSYRNLAVERHHIAQGYLQREPARTVRVRLMDDRGFITIKGRNSGAVRLEYEYAIGAVEANEILRGLCEQPFIDKTRYYVPYDGNVWEVDEFHGQLEGLVLAELEVPSTEHKYNIPPFVGKDVTGDARYYNSCLCDCKSAAMLITDDSEG